MGLLPLPNSLVSAQPGFRASLVTGNITALDDDATQLLSTLRKAVCSRSHPPGKIYCAATDLARILTSAEGTALAMHDHRSVVTCYARSGALSPEVGAALDGSSGISGACFRTGKPMRCNDTHADEHVNQELCLKLGLRSILVVPVWAGEKIIGILEALSSRPNAFEREGDLHVMQGLAEIVGMAHLGPQSPSATPEAWDIIEARRNQIRSELADARSWSSFMGSHSTGKKGRYWIATGVLVILISLVTGLTWRRRHSENLEQQHSFVHLGQQRSLPDPAPLALKPLPGRVEHVRRAAQAPVQSRDVLRSAARIETLDDHSLHP